ncbi:winged helix-turn-helix transcriptional regulator, partial [Bifidobacterium sp. 82T10]|nr:winged helix-turn-helix transcriptional regulator [Bifidobacterium miconis]
MDEVEQFLEFGRRGDAHKQDEAGRAGDGVAGDDAVHVAQLAKATGLSVSTVQSRVQKLEKRGVIKGYSAVIDHDQRGLP